MKKLIIKPLLLITLLFGAFLTIVSCKKENISPKQEESENNQFVGSRWRTDDLAANIVWGGKNYHELRFRTNKDFEIVKIKSETIDGIYREGTYEIKDKTVILNFTEPIADQNKWWLLLTDRITLERVSESGVINQSGVYTKYIRQD